MDKVRAIVGVIWTQRFWVLSVVGTLAALACWMMASGKLQAEFTANKKAIEGKFGEMSAISQKSVHGNEGVNAKEREEARKIALNVQQLWKKLYDHQREQVLYWPEALGSDFVSYIDKLKFDSPINGKMRDRYLNYIKTRFDALVEMVDARKMQVAGGAFEGAMSRGGRRGESMPGYGTEGPIGPDGMPIEEDYLVEWVDQGMLRERLEFPRIPTARQIWVTQEDLWVYETLLKVIDSTNEERGASRPDNTAIRVIQSLEVGAPAVLATEEPNIIILGGDDAGAGADYSSGEMGGRPVGRPDSYGADGEAASIDDSLLVNRYLDAEGKPITDAASGLGVEYRRLPVRMVLMMDQKWIPKLLVECANAPLPIEVERLRINPAQSAAGFDATAGAGMGGRGGGGYGGYGGGRGGEMMGRPSPVGRPSGGYGRGSMPGSSAMPELTGVGTADMATVEIQGLVYIYNPPDPTTLAVPGDENIAAADAAVVR